MNRLKRVIVSVLVTAAITLESVAPLMASGLGNDIDQYITDNQNETVSYDEYIEEVIDENVTLKDEESYCGTLFLEELDRTWDMNRASMHVAVPDGDSETLGGSLGVSKYKFYVSETGTSDSFVCDDSKEFVVSGVRSLNVNLRSMVGDNIDIIYDKVTHNYKEFYVYAKAYAEDEELVYLGDTNTLHLSAEDVQGVPEEGTSYSTMAFIQYDENGEYKEIDRLVIHEGEEIRVGLAVKKTGSDEIIPVEKVQGLKEYYERYDGSGVSACHEWDITDTEGMATSKYVNTFDTNLNTGYKKYTYYFEGVGITENSDISNVEAAGEASCYIKAMTYCYKNSSSYDCYGMFNRSLPVTVLPAEEGVTYVKHNRLEGAVKDKKEALNMIRQAYRTRQTDTAEGYTICVETGLLDSDGLMYEIYDMFAEREGMRPDEGDYLHYCVGTKDNYMYDGEDFSYSSEMINGEYCDVFAFKTKHITTYAEEQAVDEKVKQILAGPLASVNNDSATNAQKSKAAFDWVVKNVSSSGGDRREPLKHTAYNAFINGNGTCEAYALAYGRLLRELGVPNKLIAGTDANAHSYNIVLFDKEADGKQYYYYCDTSQNIYKKSYREFSRTEEQTHYTMPKFITNYLSKIKGYGTGTNIIDVIDKDGTTVYQCETLVEARGYIVSMLDEELKQKWAGSFVYEPSTTADNAPHYTLVLNQDITGKSRGELDFAGSGDSDLSQSDMYYNSFSWDYSEYVDINLNGHTITQKASSDHFSSDYTLRASKVYNGTIKINRDSWLYLLGHASQLNSDTSSAKYAEYSNVTINGVNNLDEVYLLGKVQINSDCRIPTKISGYTLEYGAKIDTDITTTNVWVKDEAILGNVVTDNLDLASWMIPNEYYNEKYDLSVNSLTVNKKSLITADYVVTVKERLSLNGTTDFQRSIMLDGEDTSYYGKLYVKLAKAKNSGGSSIAQLNLSGTFNNKCTKPGTKEIIASSIDVSVYTDDASLSTKIPVNMVLGSMNNVSAFVENTSAKKKIDNSNITKFIHIDDKYRTKQTQNLDLSGGILSFADRLEGEVGSGAANAYYCVKYKYDEDHDGEAEEFNRFYPTIDASVDAIDSIEKAAGGSESSEGILDYTLEIIKKNEDIHINKMPKAAKTLTIVGKGLKSVYLEITPKYNVFVDIENVDKSNVFVTNNYWTDGVHSDSNSDSLIMLNALGKTKVALLDESTYVNTLVLTDKAQLLVNGPSRIGYIQIGDEAQITLGESTVNGAKVYGCLTTDGFNLRNSDDSSASSVKIVDLISAGTRYANKDKGAEIVLKSNGLALDKVDYSTTTGASQHIIIDGEENYRTLYKVTAAISKIVCSSIKSLTDTDGKKYNAISQEVASVKEYAYTIDSSEATSSDILSVTTYDASGAIIPFSEDILLLTGSASVSIDRANKVLKIGTAPMSIGTKVAKVVVRNESTDSVISEFYVNTTAPAWTKNVPGVSVKADNDTTLNFSVTAPRGISLNDKYYVAIKLVPNDNTDLPSYIKLNTNPIYVRVNDDGTIPDVPAINAFYNTNKGGNATEPGEGCGAKFDAQVSIILTKNGKSPVEDYFLETAFKKVSVATKAAMYAEKISIKKKTTSLYAVSANGLKVAEVDLGSKTNFKTTDFWQVKSITDASGKDAGEMFVKYGNSRQYNGASADKNDTGIYVTPNSDTKAGKYKVTVQTVISGQPQAVETAFDITILPTISQIGISYDEEKYGSDHMLIYKKAGGAATAKYTLEVLDQDGNKIKSPKLTYTAGELNGDAVTPVDGLSASNGKITVKKDFVPDKTKQYVLEVKQADVTEGRSIASARVNLSIDTDALNIGKLEVYSKDGSLLTAEDAVPFSETKDLQFCVLDKEGKYIYGTEGSPKKDLISENYKIRIEGLENIQKLNASGTVKLTAKGADGTSASAQVKIAYDNVSLSKLHVYYKAADGETPVELLAADNGTYEMKGRPTSSVIQLYLSDDAGNVTYDLANNKKKALVEGNVEISGLKVIKNAANKQYMEAQLTQKTATVTYKKSGSVVASWTITNDAFVKVAAPAVSKVTVNGTDKLYSNYDYKEGDNLIFTLKEPLKDADKKEIPASNVNIEMNTSAVDCVLGEPLYEVKDVVISKTRTDRVATITVSMNGLVTKKFKTEFSYKDKSTGEYLTKTITSKDVSPSKFSKSFSVNSTITLSLKDAYSSDIASKSKGVKSVTYTGLLNGIKSGVYNEFADTFGIENGKTLVVKDATKLKYDKKGVPKPLEGYVTSHVLYENGETADYISKIKVQWKATTKSYKTVTAKVAKGIGQTGVTILANNADCGILTCALVASGNDKYFESVDVVDGKLVAKLKDSVKSVPGTYKTQVYIVPSGAAVTDEKAMESVTSEAAYNARFAIKVQIVVTVEK